MATLQSHTELVKKYNALPRQRLAPSGRVPNIWHFDLRYIPLSPPSHMLFILQKESHFVAQEVLPLGRKVTASGLTYFPDTAKEAALEICVGLMHSFNTKNNIGFAPWKLTTDDRLLAKAVEEQFKTLGVKEDRSKVEYLGGTITDLAQEHFDDLYKQMKSMLGLKGIIEAALVTPQSISFSNLPKTEPKAWAAQDSSSSALDSELDDDANLMEINQTLDYAREFMNNEPKPVNGTADPFPSNMEETLGHVRAVLNKMTLEQVRKKADAGDAQHAIDAALRLKHGINCTPDGVLSKQYLIQAAFDEKASHQTRSMAHSMLIFWYILGRGDELRSRYMFAASYHADEAVRLVSEGAPIILASPNVLLFAHRSFEPMSSSLQVPELLIHFKWVMKANDERSMYMKLEREAGERKMMKKPNRYRCANVGCGIESDTGKMLSQCSGKCDRDKKPSYCSRACRKCLTRLQKYHILNWILHANATEKEDWKIHKAFCRPGAPCSVIDTSITPTGISQQGAIRVPVRHADGSTTILSSSTLDPEMLKEMRDALASSRSSNGSHHTITEIEQFIM